MPVGNHMVRPSRLFFHLSDELVPFLFEVPRIFGSHDALFRAMGARDTTDHTECLLDLLSELRVEFAGAPLNASEICTTIQILHRLSDSLSETAQSQAPIMLPSSASTLEPASNLYHNDAQWMLARVDVTTLRFAHPLLPLHLASRFGVPKLSEAVVERLDASFSLEPVDFPDTERWNDLLHSEQFCEGVTRVANQNAELDSVALETEFVATVLAPYSVHVVQRVPTRFYLLSRDGIREKDITLDENGSQFFVDQHGHRLLLAKWPDYVRPEDLLAQAVSQCLHVHDTVLPLGPLLGCAVVSISSLLDVLHVGGTTAERWRGTPGTAVLAVDEPLLQLRPLREYHSGEVVAWRDESGTMLYGTVVSTYRPKEAAPDGASVDSKSRGLPQLQRVEIRWRFAQSLSLVASLVETKPACSVVSPSKGLFCITLSGWTVVAVRRVNSKGTVRSFLATAVFSFRSNRGVSLNPLLVLSTVPLDACVCSLRASFCCCRLATLVGSANAAAGEQLSKLPNGAARDALVAVDGSNTPSSAVEPSLDGGTADASLRTVAPQALLPRVPVRPAEISAAVGDLLGLLDVPLDLDQAKLLEANLHMQEELRTAQQQLSALQENMDSTYLLLAPSGSECSTQSLPT